MHVWNQSIVKTIQFIKLFFLNMAKMKIRKKNQNCEKSQICEILAHNYEIGYSKLWAINSEMWDIRIERLIQNCEILNQNREI